MTCHIVLPVYLEKASKNIDLRHYLLILRRTAIGIYTALGTKVWYGPEASVCLTVPKNRTADLASFQKPSRLCENSSPLKVQAMVADFA